MFMIMFDSFISSLAVFFSLCLHLGGPLLVFELKPVYSKLCSPNFQPSSLSLTSSLNTYFRFSLYFSCCLLCFFLILKVYISVFTSAISVSGMVFPGYLHALFSHFLSNLWKCHFMETSDHFAVVTHKYSVS